MLSASTDKYAQVYANVPQLLRAFTSLHSALDTYIRVKSSGSMPLSSPFLHVDKVAPVLKAFAVKETPLQILKPAHDMMNLVESCICQILALYRGHLARFPFDEELKEKLSKLSFMADF
jgi:hypothetical protein